MGERPGRHFVIRGKVVTEDDKPVLQMTAEGFENSEVAKMYSDLVHQTLESEEFAAKVDALFEATALQ